MKIKLRTSKTIAKPNILINILIISKFICIWCYKHKLKKYCKTPGTDYSWITFTVLWKTRFKGGFWTNAEPWELGTWTSNENRQKGQLRKEKINKIWSNSRKVSSIYVTRQEQKKLACCLFVYLANKKETDSGCITQKNIFYWHLFLIIF